MSKIIRTPTKALGGITPDEKAAFDAHAQDWIKVALRTDPIDPAKITPAIKGIYAAAGLKEPRVVIASSPLVMAAAYGAAAAIWHQKRETRNATESATRKATLRATDRATCVATDHSTYVVTGIAARIATDSATRIATESATTHATENATTYATENATCIATVNATCIATVNATRNATDWATDSATHKATRSATESATDIKTDIETRIATYWAAYLATDRATQNVEQQAMTACFDLAGKFGVECAKNWHVSYQGGNMWASLESYLTACRDVLGLQLPEYEAYAHWEAAAREGGFRVMHPEFCIVSDFPEFIKTDKNNEPHCENGPSHRWRDGWSLYHWHGVRVPANWIECPDDVSPDEVLSTENVEQRAAGIAIIGMAKILDKLEHKIIDSDPDPARGDLIQVRLADLPEPGLYLKAECPRNGTIVLGVPKTSDIDGLPINTVFAAQAYLHGLPKSSFTYPEVRT